MEEGTRRGLPAPPSGVIELNAPRLACSRVKCDVARGNGPASSPACGGGATRARRRRATAHATRPRPIRAASRPLCERADREELGRRRAPAPITELSGLALSQAGTLLDAQRLGRRPARVRARHAPGVPRARSRVAGRRGGRLGGHRDPRAHALRRRHRRQPRAAARRHRLPRSPSRAAARRVRPQRIDLRYPDGAHDAEALLVDPRTGATRDRHQGLRRRRRRLRRAATARCASGRRSTSASASRSPPATSPATAARSSCAPTTARSSGRAAAASRSPARSSARRAPSARTCSTKARASRSR